MNKTLFNRTFALLAVCPVLWTISFDCASADDFAWKNSEADHQCDLVDDGKALVRYMYAPLDESSGEKRAETYKPYLHVYSPDGSKLITKGPGGLFPHHRGIYFGFNRISYGDGKRCDTWHCRGKAYQQHQKFGKMEANEDGGTIESIVHWHGQDGEAFASEARTMSVGQADSMTRVDFESTLSAVDGVDKIHLDGDPQHAGVQFRASQKVPDETAKQTYYIRQDGKGKEGETRNYDHRNKNAKDNDECTNRPWLALSFVLDGERYTVVYLDHPKNPKPSHYSERDYGRFGSYFVADVTPDKPLKVKYRYWIKQGEMTQEECQKLYDAFVGE